MSPTVLLALILASVLLLILLVWKLRRLSLQGLVTGIMGVVIGLVIGALVSVPLGMLPEPYGSFAPMVAAVAFTLLTVAIVSGHKTALIEMIPFLQVEAPVKPERAASGRASGRTSGRTLVDTSAIIDGRIADVAAAGFLPPTFIVPRFVLAELQNIADSEDAMRRGRGRRGLEVLNKLRDTPGFSVEVTDEDVESIREVDAKLVALAQRFDCDVLTTDFNLNRVAQIQGVRVLNVNELSNAIRPVVIPGEEMIVHVVQPGKERGQGVGYLADGTMIVVENGDKLIGQDVPTEVTRVFQTVAGKMIFAVPRHPLATPKPKHSPEQKSITVAESKPEATNSKAPEPKPSVMKSDSAPQAKPILEARHKADRRRIAVGSDTKPAVSHSSAYASKSAAVSAESHMAQRPNQRRRRLSGSAAIEERLVAKTSIDTDDPKI